MLVLPIPRGYHPNQAHLGTESKISDQRTAPTCNTFPKPPFLEPSGRAGPLSSLTKALARPFHPMHPEGQLHA